MCPLFTIQRILSFTIIFCFFTIKALAQNPDVLEVSYQESTTEIRSQAVDENGNTYYAGNFIGALIVAGDTLAYGVGEEDYFVVKQDSNRQTIWAIPFGSKKSDKSHIIIHYHKGHIYLSFGLNDTIVFAGNSITPLAVNITSTNCLVQLNPNGDIQWYKTGTAPITGIQSLASDILTTGVIWGGLKNATFDKDTIHQGNGYNTTLLQKIDVNGENTGSYPIYYTYGGTAYVFATIRCQLKENRLYFLLTTSNSGSQTGAFAIHFNNTIIATNNNINGTSILVKTDTLMQVLHHKLLNPSGGSFYTGAIPSESNFQFSADSSKLHLMINYGNYNNDGFNQSATNKFGIATLDSNLITKSISILQPQTFVENLHRIITHHFTEYNGHFYFLMSIVGNSPSPSPILAPQNLKSLQIAPNKMISYNINGPSTTFLLKTSTNLSYIQHTLVSDLSLGEANDFKVGAFTIRHQKIYLTNSSDNLWNPYQIQTNGTVLNGLGPSIADDADFVEKTVALPQKKKLLLGYTEGLNAFDSSSNFIGKSIERRDFFFTILDSTLQVKKYVRLFSSYAYATIGKTILKNDSVFALITLNGPKNQPGFNYYSIGGKESLATTFELRLLLGIDSAGNVSLRNFQETPVGAILDFDFFANGDFALLSENNTTGLLLNGQQFPTRPGFYVLRMGKQGNSLKALKLQHEFNMQLTPRNIQVYPETDDLNLVMQTIAFPGMNSIGIITSRNGSQETLQTIANPNSSITSLKSYLLISNLSFEANNSISIAGPFSSFWIPASFGKIKNASFIYLGNLESDDIVYFNNTPLFSKSNGSSSALLRINREANIVKSIIFPESYDPALFSFFANQLKIIDGNVFLTGYQTIPLKIDNITIPYTGNADGLVIKVDTSLNMLQYYRVASTYSDYCTDIDIFPDASIVLAYRSQGNPIPQIGLNQVSLLQPTSGILPSDLEEAGYLTQIPASLAPVDFVFTIKNGSWHNATIWNTGTVPKSTDRVFVRHKVQILQNTECYQVFVDPTSDLKVGDGIKLTVTGYDNNQIPN